jgi:hypothetical protein
MFGRYYHRRDADLAQHQDGHPLTAGMYACLLLAELLDRASLLSSVGGDNRSDECHRDRARARRQAAEVLVVHCARGTTSGAPEPPPRSEGDTSNRTPITLGELASRYLPTVEQFADGCLKTEGHRKACAKCFDHLVKHFGLSCPVESITPDRVKAYAFARRSGRITGRKVRTRSVRADLLMLTAATRWASCTIEDGAPLLARNPLTGFRLPTERDHGDR